MNSPAGCSVQWDNDGGTGNPGWETNSLDMDDFGQAHDTYLAHDVALSLYLSSERILLCIMSFVLLLLLLSHDEILCHLLGGSSSSCWGPWSMIATSFHHHHASTSQYY